MVAEARERTPVIAAAIEDARSSGTLVEVADDDERWTRILGDAVSALDEAEKEAYEKRLAKHNRKYYDIHAAEMGAVRAFLVEYAKCERCPSACARSVGVKLPVLASAMDEVPSFHLVYKTVRARRDKIREMQNEELLDHAREGLDKLVSEEGCELNVKAVTFAMEKLDRRNFGSGKQDDGGGGATVVYNLPNMSVNLIMSPGELADEKKSRLGAVKSGEVIDAEVVPSVPEKMLEAVKA